jgi:beta-glucanase (GH16 family)
MTMTRTILTAVAIQVCFVGARSVKAEPPSKDYALVWSDEFDGAKLDRAKWGFHQPGPRRKAINTEDCAALDGQGNLALTTKRVGNAYHTSMIDTRGKFEPIFGYFEARMKFQTQQGHWSAFWLQSPTLGPAGDAGKYGTEIDIIEFLGKQRDTMLMNLHWDGYGKDHKHAGSKYVDKSLTEGFHLIGLEWTPEAYVFYLDGKEVWRTGEGISHA